MNIELPQLRGSGHLTHSRMGAFKSCPRKHYYRYEVGVRTKTDATALRIGSAIHKGVELWYTGTAEAECIAEATRGYEVLPSWASTEEKVHEWMTERETVAALLAGYFWRWGDDQPQEFRIKKHLAVEVAFDLPIVNPQTNMPARVFRVAGKIDGIVELEDGRVLVRETKTTGEDIGHDSDYWRRLRLDQQISLYMVAAKQEAYPVTSVLYDVVRKPSIRPRKITRADFQSIMLGTYCGIAVDPKDIHVGDTETPAMYAARLTQDIAERPDFYFRRVEIPRLAVDLEEFEWELWQQAQVIREAQKTGRHYRNTAACVGFGRCEYLDICHNGIDPANVPAGFQRVDDIHPELST